MATRKGGGGLKLLTAIVVIGAAATGVYSVRNTEVMQRVRGQREDHRLDRNALAPRFGFASAALRVTVGTFYNDQGSPVDLTTTRDISIDRQSRIAVSHNKLERTATEVEPGVTALPFDAIKADYTEILTAQNRYESPSTPDGPWTVSAMPPHYYGTELDDDYIPMIDDIIGFELRGLPATTASSPPPAGNLRSGLKSTDQPRVAGDAPPLSVATSYTYSMDLETFRRAVPIIAGRTDLAGLPNTPVTLTLGFDEVGLLRFADVGITSDVASTLAVQLGTGHQATYHYTLSVETISGEPLAIEVPTNVVPAA